MTEAALLRGSLCSFIPNASFPQFHKRHGKSIDPFFGHLAPLQTKTAQLLNSQAVNFVHPWGVEPQSKEPESFILSIELRVPLNKIEVIAALTSDSPLYLRGKSKKYL